MSELSAQAVNTAVETGASAEPASDVTIDASKITANGTDRL